MRVRLSNEEIGIHDYEKKGLGKPPFDCIGLYVVPPKELAGTNPEAYRNALQERPRVSKGTIGYCTRCGRYIIYNFLIRNGQSEIFPVGSECVNKSDKILLRKVKQLAVEGKEKTERYKHSIEIGKFNVLVDANRDQLQGIPHPNEYLANKGKSYLDYIEYMRNKTSPKNLMLWRERIEKIVKDTPVDPDLVKKSLEKKQWFVDNKDEIAEALSLIGDNKYFSDILRLLKNGERVSDGAWKSVQREVQKLKTKDSKKSFDAEFGRSPVKLSEFSFEVTSAKFYNVESAYSVYGSSYFAVMGNPTDYQEFCFVKLGDAEFGKLFERLSPGDNEIDPKTGNFIQDADRGATIKRLLANKTITLKGTFQYNGKMIIGKRIKVTGVK